MHILYLTHYFDLPEAEMCLALIQRGVIITVVANPFSPHLDRIEASGMSVHRYPIGGRISPSAIFYLRRLLRSSSFDLIHSFSNRGLSNALFASLTNPIPHVTYRGTMGHLSAWDPLSHLGHRNTRLSKIICVSNAVRDYLIASGIPEGRTITIYKGHRPEWYAGPPLNRSTFEIPENVFLVSCAANMRPVKGVDFLIRAFADLPENIHLLLIGEVRDNQIWELTKQYPGRIHLTGYRNDVPSILDLSDVFVMPSIEREGLPKAAIEAMCRRVVPIVTNVGGMPELVENGISGIIVPPRDPRALAQAVLSLEAQPELRERMATNAYLRIERDFHHSKTVERTLQLYNEVAHQ